jgi:hypothetical protein
MCAIGEGSNLCTAINSAEVAAFVDAAATYQGQASAQHWIQILLDPKRSNNGSTAIRASDVPATGFSNEPAFERWWQAHREQVALLLDEPPVTGDANVPATQAANGEAR